jgi:hypothetical protein
LIEGVSKGFLVCLSSFFFSSLKNANLDISVPPFVDSHCHKDGGLSRNRLHKLRLEKDR